MAIPFYQYNEEEDCEVVGEKVVEIEPEQDIDTETRSDAVTEFMEDREGISFVGRLLQELVGVYLRLSSGRRSGVRRERQRINSGNGEGSTSSSTHHTTPTASLPDLLCSTHPLAYIPQNRLTPNRKDPMHPIPRSLNPLRPRVTSSSQTITDDDATSELAFDLKMTVDISYKSIGRDLRRIADEFELANSTRYRRRHGDNPGSKISLKFELAFKFVIPATLLGLSLAILRK